MTNSTTTKSALQPLADICEFGDERLAKNLNELPRFAPAEKAVVLRVAILSKPLHTNIHYVSESVGTCRCVSNEERRGPCCAKLGDSQRRFVTLALKYMN